MIKERKKQIIIMAAAFLVLLVVYFAVIRPLIAVTDEDGTAVDLLDGEVAITAKTTNFYIYQPLQRSSIQSIEVTNEFGGYKVYRDASDSWQLNGYAGLQFDAEKFSSLVVTTGTPTAMMRVATDLDEAGLAEYGLDKPQASWTLTATTGETYTIYVGDNLITEGGYYVKYEPRNAVYILSNTLADTILKPSYNLLQPILTGGISQNEYPYIDEFTLWKDGELFVNVGRVPDEDMPHDADGNIVGALVENYMTYPRPEAVSASAKDEYDLNDDLYYQVLYNIFALQGDSVVDFIAGNDENSDEIYAKYGLDEPKYMFRYVYKDYEFIVFASEKQPDGGYYAVSNLYGFSLVCHVEAGEKLSWLEKDKFSWIFPTPFFENITTVKKIEIHADNGIKTADVSFKLTHGTDSDGNNTLEVEDDLSGVVIGNADIGNFRQFYKTLLNITNQQYATMDDEDRLALIANNDNIIMTMSYEGLDGNIVEYKFYKYVEESTGKISGGKIFVAVNGMGEFYTTNDLVNKIINDTSRVLEGLDIDSYGRN